MFNQRQAHGLKLDNLSSRARPRRLNYGISSVKEHSEPAHAAEPVSSIENLRARSCTAWQVSITIDTVIMVISSCTGIVSPTSQPVMRARLTTNAKEEGNAKNSIYGMSAPWPVSLLM